MKKPLIATIIVALLVGVLSFYAGMQFQKTQRSRNAGQFNFAAGQTGQGQRLRQNGMGRPVRGEIISSDDKSITVKMQDGSSKIVLLSTNTTIIEATSASKQALEKGKQVMVYGTDNSDGSLTAQNVQLNPQDRFGTQPSSQSSR